MSMQDGNTDFESVTYAIPYSMKFLDETYETFAALMYSGLGTGPPSINCMLAAQDVATESYPMYIVETY